MELRRFFPKTNKVNYLKIDKVGEYSISRPYDAYIISNLIKMYIIEKELGKDLIITDATSCVGGNTISFCNFFNKVNAIEIDQKRFSYLCNNLKIYNFTNKTNLIKGNFLKIVPKINQDIIFIDPPWGGKEYYKSKSMDITVSEFEISEIAYNFLDKKYCKLIVLKLPYNYNLNNFNKKKYDIRQILIRKKILILFISLK